MKRFATAFGLLLSLAGFAQAGDTFKVDPDHSFVHFRVQHMGASYTYGRFNQPSGTFVLDKEDPSKSSFEVSVEVAKVDTANAKRDEHLKKEDFFNVAEFPKISFKSTGVKKVDDKTIEVTGNLSLHGVTKSITTTMEFVGEGKNMMGGTIAGYEVKPFKINRSDYGMTNMVGPVGDEVTLVISLEGGKQ